MPNQRHPRTALLRKPNNGKQKQKNASPSEGVKVGVGKEIHRLESLHTLELSGTKLRHGPPQN